MSEINPPDHKSITARHFLRDNKQVEADFSIRRNYGASRRPSKRHNSVHHVWCLDLGNMKEFFERVRDYQAKKYNIAILYCID